MLRVANGRFQREEQDLSQKRWAKKKSISLFSTLSSLGEHWEGDRKKLPNSSQKTAVSLCQPWWKIREKEKQFVLQNPNLWSTDGEVSGIKSVCEEQIITGPPYLEVSQNWRCTEHNANFPLLHFATIHTFQDNSFKIHIKLAMGFSK